MKLSQNRVFCAIRHSFLPRSAPRTRTMAGWVSSSRIVRRMWSRFIPRGIIISETVILLRYRADYKTAVQFLDVIKPSLSIVRYDDSVRSAAEEVFKKFSKDKKISFCDALSFVIITDLLDDMPCLTFDRDFRGLGLMVYPE